MAPSKDRYVMDLKSQDLEPSDLIKFRDAVVPEKDDAKFDELLSFNSGSKPYNYHSLDEFNKNRDAIPDDATYFSYTINLDDGRRISLYLDPDRPGKVVLEGDPQWIEKKKKGLNPLFMPGGERYKVHSRIGIFFIWVVVISIAAVILLITTLIRGPDPVVVSSVIFTSSVLGIYLSIVKAKEIQPANTISFVKRRKYWLDTLLHLLTITLGIISAIFATIIVERLM